MLKRKQLELPFPNLTKPCMHLRLEFDPGAGGLYLDCKDCDRRFIAGKKDTMTMTDFYARSEFHGIHNQRYDPYTPFDGFKEKAK